MKRLEIADIEIEECPKVFSALSEVLLKQGAKVRKKKEICRLLGWNPSVWSRLMDNRSKEITLANYHSKLTQACKFAEVAIFQASDGEYHIEPLDLPLSALIESWEREYPKEVGHYLYHYVANQRAQGESRTVSEMQIRRAYLLINYASGNICLSFIRSTQDRAKNLGVDHVSWSLNNVTKDLKSNLDEWVVARYYGQVEIERNQLYLNFDRRWRFNKRKKTEETLRHRGLNIFALSGGDKKLKGTYVGNFSSFGPASGMCAVVEHDRHMILGLMHQKMDASIRHALIGSSHSLKNNKELYDLERHKFLLETINNKGLIQTYWGLSLISRSGSEGIGIARFTIGAYGEISYESKACKGTPQMGYIFHTTELEDYDRQSLGREEKSHVESTVVSCCINYSSSYDHHQMFMALETNTHQRKDHFEDGVLLGVYAGLYSKSKFPQSGRVMLVPTKSVDKPMEIENIPFSEVDKVNNLLMEFPHLMPFLGGAFDYFGDRPFLAATSLMQHMMNQWERPANHDNLSLLGGWYRLVYPNSEADNLYERVMSIHPTTGAARIFRQVEKGQSKKVYHGYARHINRSLVVNIDILRTLSFRTKKQEETNVYRGCAVKVNKHPSTPQPGDFFTGVIYRENDDDVPNASSLIIQFLGKDPLSDEQIRNYTREVLWADRASCSLDEALVIATFQSDFDMSSDENF